MPGDAISPIISSPRNDTTNPVGLVSQWRTVITAGGPAVQDAATITNPTTQITSLTRLPLIVAGAGTHALVRLGYDDGLTLITNPVIKVFGKTASDVWQPLITQAGTMSIAVPTVPATDVADGTLLYTAPSFDLLSFDLLGCNEILVGIETALAGTGVVTNSILQVKII